ncbi:MAG: polyprenyl synthetase family protein [Pseudomonadota bacterium]
MSNVTSLRLPSASTTNGGQALSLLQSLVSDDMALVNSTILERMESPVSLIPQLAGHLIASGGKRLRPMLTLASSKMVGYEGKRQCKLAACVEFIHTATLLHDDVVDESALRRGRDTANAVWGNQASVLVGDFLFSRAFELMVEDGSLKVLKILSSASSIIAEGEVQQMMTVSDLKTDEDTYMNVIGAKTAALFAAACQISAVVAERPEHEENALAAYGRNLGLAFQIVDDVLDYSANQKDLGKTVGDDFQEGKVSLPVILAFQRSSPSQKAFWQRTIGSGDLADGDLEFAINNLEETNALADAAKRAHHFADRALDCLSLFPHSTARQALADVVHFCVQRGH